MDVLQSRAYKLADEEFNLASPKQLQVILFEKLCLAVLKKTGNGQPSTAEPVLQELATDYGEELPRVILEYRSLSKLKSTYTDALPLQIDPETGRIHTTYNQAVTATGRLSSTDPNLQNIPIRTSEGRRIRKAFTSSQGQKIVAADYSQIELRIMAHLSEDLGLTKAFSEGLDVHKSTAADIFDCELDEVTADQRRSAKAINFGLIYGMSAFGLGRQLGIARNLASDYMDRYFQRYPAVHEFMEETRLRAHKDGFVETIYGRRLYLPDINARNKQRQQGSERQAVNAPMQGSAADIIKRAMVEVDAWLQNSSGVRQHFELARLRAVELRTGIIRSANTGISGIIDPSGKVKHKVKFYDQEVFQGKVLLNKNLTFYARFGSLFSIVCFILILIQGVYKSIRKN